MKPKTINDLLRACDKFEKMATGFDLTKVVNTYKPLLAAEVAAGIRSINRLVTTNKDAAKAQSLQSLDDIFGRVGETVNNLNAVDPRGSDIAVKNMLAVANSGTFYTSSYNAGIGYDPITRMGGGDSPAAHLNKIIEILKKFEGYVRYNEVIAPKTQE